MLNQDLLKETLDTANLQCFECKRTATSVRAFAVRFHAIGCSLRKIQKLFGYRPRKLSPSDLTVYIKLLTAFLIRLRWSRSGSGLTRPLSKLTVNCIGSTLQ